MEHSAKSRFAQLDGLRRTFLTRCERYAAWTLPMIFPPEGIDDSDEMSTDYQSLGAKLVNSLANKLSLAMFAPSRPFFRLRIAESVRQVLKEKYKKDDPTIDVALSLTAKEGMQTIERAAARPVIIRGMKQLIITGNTCIYRSKEKGNLRLRTYGLRNYVVQRDVQGNPIELIVRDTSTLGAMPTQVQHAYRLQYPDAKDDTKVSLYNWCILQPSGAWKCKQYIEEIALSGTDSQYKATDFPYAVLVWDLAENRHYGNGLVEQYQGDFHGMTTLNAAYLSGLAEMCRIIHLADPTGDVNVKEFEQALSGDVIAGREKDITTPDLGGKARDYATVQAKLSAIERSLAEAFLYAQAAVRDAERVTAEEVRLIQRELESAFGGIYSQLATDFQAWLAQSILKELKLPFEGDITPVLITGIDAMSANGDLENMQLFLNDLAGIATIPPLVQERINMDGIIKVLAGFRQVEFYKFLLDEKEVVAKQQRAIQAQQQMQAQQADAQAQANVREAAAIDQVTGE